MNPDPDKRYIRLEGLTRTYREGGCEHVVLAGLNGEIAGGEVVALLGSSGSGKSTLLNIMGGIDAPTAGRVVIGGVDITGLSEEARTLFRRRHIGFVYQFFNLVPTLTVEENLLLPLELNSWPTAQARARAREMLELVGLAARSDSFPDQLSGGEQQRVALARALIHEPDLVLADEPTGNLDAANGRQVLDLLERLVREQGRTLILVTHSQAVAARADRILTLQQGRLEGIRDGLLW